MKILKNSCFDVVVHNIERRRGMLWNNNNTPPQAEHMPSNSSICECLQEGLCEVGRIVMARNVMMDNGLDVHLIAGVKIMYIDMFGTIIVDFIV